MADLDRSELIERLRALEPQLRARGVTGMALFGSRARGDNGPDSDVDVALHVPAGSRFSLFDLMDVEDMVARTAGIRAHVLLARSVEPWLAEELARDAVPVLP